MGKLEATGDLTQYYINMNDIDTSEEENTKVRRFHGNHNLKRKFSNLR